MITYNNFKNTVISNNALSLVQFKTEWNGASQILEMIFNDLTRSYAGVVDFFSVDFDEERQLANEYGVMEIPTILFFKEGVVVDHVIGMIPRNQLISKIEIALSK